MQEHNQEKRILFTGASGSGTTTLGRRIAEELNIPHYDLDDFFWKKTEIPYTEFRTKTELLELIEEKLYSKESWIISGDPSEWQVGIEDKLTQVYFLECTAEIRVKRLNKREFLKQGEKILEGGKNYENHRKFIEWTKKYDIGGVSGRTKPKQEKWVNSLDCKLYRFNTNKLEDNLVQDILLTLR